MSQNKKVSKEEPSKVGIITKAAVGVGVALAVFLGVGGVSPKGAPEAVAACSVLLAQNVVQQADGTFEVNQIGKCGEKIAVVKKVVNSDELTAGVMKGEIAPQPGKNLSTANVDAREVVAGTNPSALDFDSETGVKSQLSLVNGSVEYFSGGDFAKRRAQLAENKAPKQSAPEPQKEKFTF